MKIHTLVILSTLLVSVFATVRQSSGQNLGKSQTDFYKNRDEYATAWDMISAKYIDFISNTYLGNLVRESRDAYNILT